MRIALCLACLIGAVSTSAWAQDGSEVAEKRTVEGAQQFLDEYYSKLAGQIQVYAWVYRISGPWELKGRVPPSSSAAKAIEADLVSLNKSDRCKSKIIVKNAMLAQDYIAQRREPLPEASGTYSEIIDWSDIGPVTVSERTKTYRYDPTGERHAVGWWISFKGGPVTTFYHPDEESARRAGLAMEFLREQCGVKTKTGF